MARKLKVFSAEMGFVRAVVAAPNRKAALEAWGVRDDLFARKTAREESDPGLVKQALAKPGEVVRAPIASGAEIVSAAEAPKAGKATAAKPKGGKKPAPRKPAPSRDRLDKALEALKAVEAERRKALAEIEAEQAALDRKRDAAEARFSKRIDKAEGERDRLRADYDAALKAWKG